MPARSTSDRWCCTARSRLLDSAYRAAARHAAARTAREPKWTRRSLRRALVLAPPSAAGVAVAAPLRRYRRRLRVRLDAVARRRAGDAASTAASCSRTTPTGRAQRSIDATGAARIIVTHGQVPIMVRWLSERGLHAQAFETDSTTKARTMRRRCCEATNQQRRTRATADRDASVRAPVRASSTRRHRRTRSLRRSTRISAGAEPRTPHGRPISSPAAGRGSSSRGVLRDVAMAAAGLPRGCSTSATTRVGDLAETLAHVLPPPRKSAPTTLAEWIDPPLLPLRRLPRRTRRSACAVSLRRD